MTKTPPKPRASAPAGKDDRLKAALKANMAKRKAQARARKATGENFGGKEESSNG